MANTSYNRLRLAVIGAGAIGRKHAMLIKESSAAELAALSDISPTAHRFADELKVPYFQDYRKMLACMPLDGGIVATPTSSHTAVGLACAENGVHILMEKPIADSLEEARLLVDGARKHGISLLVGHHRRYNPLVQCIRETIAAGGIGRLVAVNVLWMLKKPDDYYHASWRCQPGGGPFLINMIHDIDTLRYTCGEITKVYAESSSAVRNLEVEDTGSVTVRFAGGAVGSILISDCTPSRWSYEQSTGENPFYFRTDGNCYLFFGSDGSLAFPDMDLVQFVDKSRVGWQYPLVNRHLSAEPQDPLVAQLEHFCAVIRGQVEPRISGEDGLRTLRVVQGIAESAKTGQPVCFHWS